MSISVHPVAATLIAALVAALAAAFALWRLRTVFIVEISNGRARVKAGRVADDFLEGCNDVARRHAIRQGRISGVRDGAGVRLQFSRGIPTRSHQALRNVWTPPPPKGGPPSGGGMRASG